MNTASTAAVAIAGLVLLGYLFSRAASGNTLLAAGILLLLLVSALAR